jgi:hypothetical protein
MHRWRASFAEYQQGLESAGFTSVEVAQAHQVADGMHPAIVRAVKPQAALRPATETSDRNNSCCG